MSDLQDAWEMSLDIMSPVISKTEAKLAAANVRIKQLEAERDEALLLVEEAFNEGFHEGYDGGWIGNCSHLAWPKSDVCKELTNRKKEPTNG